MIFTLDSAELFKNGSVLVTYVKYLVYVLRVIA